MENRVYEVEIDVSSDQKLTSNSERFRIVKFYRPGRWTAEQILEEHQFLLDLLEYEIPTISPLKNDKSETLFRLPDVNIYCAVFPKIGGRSPDELDSSQLLQIGRLLARMHNVGKTREAVHRLKMTPDNFALAAVTYLENEKIIPIEIASRYVDLVKRICEKTLPLFEQVSYQRIHGDCHLGNLLWGQNGPFWVDFDDMVIGPCVQDLWLLIPGRVNEEREKLNLLLEGYESMAEFDRTSLSLIEPLRAMRFVHFNAWIARRWQDPYFQRTFVEFGSARYWGEQLRQMEEQWEIIRR